MATYDNEWFEDWISHYIQVIYKSLLNNDYDKIREYAGYAEGLIEQARKTMEENPEMKSPETEKFLEESLNKAKLALRRCPEQNTNIIRPWSDRYSYREESYQEKKARWDYEESRRYHRYRESLQQESWFNY